MTCDEAREQLSALIDEALPPSGRAACEAHVAGCADCRRELDRLRQTVAQIRALPAPRVPAGFAERVMAATRAPVGATAAPRPASSPSTGAREPWLQRALHRAFSPLRIKLPLEAAAVLLVGVGAVYLFQHTPELQEATRPYAPPPASAPARSPEPPVVAPRFMPPVPAPPSVAAPPAVSTPATPSPHALPAERREAAPPSSAPAPEPKVQGRAQEAVPAPRSQMEGARVLEAPGKEDAARDTARADQRAFIQKKADEAPGSPERQRAPARDITARQAPAPPSAPPGAAPPQATGPPRVGQIAAPSTRSGAELAAKMAAVPLLVGRLGVTDRLAADRALGELLGRVGGRELLRRAEGGELVIEVALPEGAYAPFVEGLARIGRWQPDAEPAAGVEPLQLALRVSEVR